MFRPLRAVVHLSLFTFYCPSRVGRTIMERGKLVHFRNKSARLWYNKVKLHSVGFFQPSLNYTDVVTGRSVLSLCSLYSDLYGQLSTFPCLQNLEVGVFTARSEWDKGTFPFFFKKLDLKVKSSKWWGANSENI